MKTSKSYVLLVVLLIPSFSFGMNEEKNFFGLSISSDTVLTVAAFGAGVAGGAWLLYQRRLAEQAVITRTNLLNFLHTYNEQMGQVPSDEPDAIVAAYDRFLSRSQLDEDRFITLVTRGEELVNNLSNAALMDYACVASMPTHQS